jgi:hypothetical protein
MTLLMVIHVDDVLFTPSAPKIKAEFLRLLRAKFSITGGDDLVSLWCGYQFLFDALARTITMHQQDFARAVLTKYGAADWKPVDTPMRVGDSALEPFDGKATDRSALEFAMFIGDMTWLTRTNPRLAFAVQDLAQFVHNPGPTHFMAARRVLAHLRKDTGQGLTFHGSNAVLNQSYPHRHTLIGMTDSGFSHKGAKAVSGCSVLMNGAAIYHVARRQTTVSQTSAEAEVKATALMSEVLSAVVPLWSEIAGAGHPAVRVFIDNKAAKKQCESGTDTVASAPYLEVRRTASPRSTLVSCGLILFREGKTVQYGNETDLRHGGVREEGRGFEWHGAFSI